MKHLRRFSTKYSLLEQSNEGLKELQDFCDIHLVYLSDNGFYNYIDVDRWNKYKIYHNFRLTKGYSDTKVFTWSEISDHTISLYVK